MSVYIRPTFFTLFHMMSGSVSPSSIGLNDEQHVKKLLSLSRKHFIIVKYQCQYIIPTFVALIILPTYIISTSLIELLLSGIPTMIIYSFVVLYFWNFLGYQYLYFYHVCKYLDMKLKISNEKLILIRNGKYICKIVKILHNFHAIYCEIKEYDSTYISKFLFTVWLLVDLILVIAIYINIFSSPKIIVRLANYYLSLVFSLLFIFTITTAASINYNCRRAYKLLNSLYQEISQRKMKYSKSGKYYLKYKVS